MLGTRIANRFDVVRRLGRGGMGSVWLARDLEGPAYVAIKIVAPLLAADPNVRERFRREVRLGASFHHEHMVRVLSDGILADGLPYLVMEYVPGEDLHARIARVGPLPMFETRAIVAQVCGALRGMHDRGIVHRDVKPANILLRETKDTLVVKLADFGLAHEPGASTVTQVNAVVGTPLYMSPERLGEGDVDPRSDLWSVAVVAYHCLVGHPPFEGPSYGAICFAIGQGKVAPVTSLRRGLPPALDAWFVRGLHPKAGHRFDCAVDLAATFDAACDGTAPPSGLVARGRHALAALVATVGGGAAPGTSSGEFYVDVRS